MSTVETARSVNVQHGAYSVLTPQKFIETMQAYQRTAALKAAIELELFTAIGEGCTSVSSLAERTGASQRGLRILCDFLVTAGFLSKVEDRYRMTGDTAVFLDKKSPAYLGSAVGYLGSPAVMGAYADLATVVRHGGPVVSAFPEDRNRSMWVDFARAMAPMVHLVAEEAEKILFTDSAIRVLDVAAGHGLFGITIAHHNPLARVVALDWPQVLEVARENAESAGVLDRYQLLPGDALEVAFGSDFDQILVPNLLHMWDRVTIVRLLRKAHAALSPAGRLALVEFVPNEDRVSPPVPASFAMYMLANTPGGNAYTFSEFRRMLEEAGFAECRMHSLGVTHHSLIVAEK